MSRFWSPIVHELSPYAPGEQPDSAHWIKLNTNENPYPPSPRVADAIGAELQTLRLYPEPGAETLKRAVAAVHEVSPTQVFAGNGSDEVLAHAFVALLGHEAPVLFPDITYSFYPSYCALYRVPFRTVPLDDRYRIRVNDYVQPNGGIVLANPNAPTGQALPVEQVEWLLRRNPDSVLVVDEAYVDFGGESVIPLVHRHNNLLVVRTLSKSYSLAGLRVGFAVGDPDLICALERVKNSFNSYPLDRLAIVGAVAALRDRDHFQTTRSAVISGRAYLRTGLLELGFEVLPSAANFVMVRQSAHDARDLLAALRQRRILVRHFSQPRIQQFLRISVGTHADHVTLLEALRSLVA